MAEETLKEKTAKGLFWGGVSSGMLQFFNVLFGIFLSRLLDAEDYGVIGKLAIFSAVLSTIQESGFTIALINKKNITQDDCNAVFWFNVTIGAGFYLLLYYLAPLIGEYYQSEEIISLSRFLFVSLFIGGFGIVHNAILSKKLQIKEQSVINVVSLLISGSVGVLLAYCDFSYWGLAIQSVLYIAIGTLLRWHYSQWRPTFSFKWYPIKEMLPFSYKLILTNILSQASGNIFSVILGRYYLTKDVGYYTQALKWTGMGASFVEGMVASISQPVLVQSIEDKERQKKIFRKILRFTAFLTFPLIMGLMLVANELIEITVTSKWLPCVPILRVICCWSLIQGILKLYQYTLITHGRSNIILSINLFVAITQLAVAFFLYQYGIIVMMIGYVSVFWISGFFWHYYTQKIINIRMIEVIKDITPYFIASVLSIGFSYFVIIGLISNIYMKFAGEILLSVSIYCSIMYCFKSKIYFESISYLKSKLI